MSSPAEHLAKSIENELFASSFDPAQSVSAGWRITILFYSALHVVQAYFVKYGSLPITHTRRQSAIQRDPNIRAVYVDYRELEHLSRTARYDTLLSTEAEVIIAQSRLKSINALIGPLL